MPRSLSSPRSVRIAAFVVLVSTTLLVSLSSPRETSGATTLLFDGRPLGAVNSSDTNPYASEDWYSPTKSESIKVVRPGEMGWGPVWDKVFRFRHRLAKSADGSNPGKTGTNWVWAGNSNQGRTGLNTPDVGLGNGVEQWLGRSLYFPEDFPPMAIGGGFANFRASKILRQNGGGGSSSIHWWLRDDKYTLQVQGGPIDCEGDGYISRTATLFEQIPKGIWIDIKVNILFRSDNQGYFVAWVALRTDLTEPISKGAATIPLRSTAGLPASGSLVLGGSERITYTGRTSSAVTGVTRGVGGTATDHAKGTTVTETAWKKVWDSRGERHSTLKTPDASCPSKFTWLSGHAIGVYRSWGTNVDQAPDITWGELGLLVSSGEGGINRVLGHTGSQSNPAEPPPDPDPTPDPEPDPSTEPEPDPEEPGQAPRRERGRDLPRITSFSYVTDDECDSCSVSSASNRLGATIEGSDAQLHAYGERELGSVWEGRVWTRTNVALRSDSALDGTLVLTQVRDADDDLVYQVVASGSDHGIAVVSPAGGLDDDGLRLETGAALSGTPRRIEVSAEANESVAVRVDGVLTNELAGLSGATTDGQAAVRAGIVNYSAPAGEPLAVALSNVGASMAGWLDHRTRSLHVRRAKARPNKRLVVRLQGIPRSRVNISVRSGHGRVLGRDRDRIGRAGTGRAVVRLGRWTHQHRLRVRVQATYLGREVKIVRWDKRRVRLRAPERLRLAR